MCPLHISSTSDNSHFSANSVNDDRRVKLQRCFGERGPMPRQRPSVSLPGQQSYPLPRAWRERAMAGISPLKKKKSPHFWVVFPPLLLDCLWPRCRWASSHTTQHITPRTRWTARTGEGIWWFLDYDSTLKVLFKSFKSVHLGFIFQTPSRLISFILLLQVRRRGLGHTKVRSEAWSSWDVEECSQKPASLAFSETQAEGQASEAEGRWAASGRTATWNSS